jgi:alpha-ketoglutarate-dependent taurine dioxygenase
VIIWDNRAVVHKATEYDVSQTRHLKRTTVMPTLEGV